MLFIEPLSQQFTKINNQFFSLLLKCSSPRLSLCLNWSSNSLILCFVRRATNTSLRYMSTDSHQIQAWQEAADTKRNSKSILF